MQTTPITPADSRTLEPPAAHAAEPVRRAATLRDWIQLARPPQWVKNFFVVAPLLFSGRALEPEWALRSALAFVMFCLLASTIYLWNDAADAEKDRAHPTKRQRPIAAGRIGKRQAIGVGVVLFAIAMLLAWQLGPVVLAIAGTYVGLNLLYTMRLKEMVLLDVFAVASFFLLRLLAGSAAIEVRASVWLLLCGGLLALYLGFTKRRHELTLLGASSADHRSVLSHYSTGFLDQMSSVLLAVTVVSYIMYTLTSETARQVGDDALSYSTIFVLYGVFRYLYLVHQRNGGSPTKTLLTDRSLMVTVVLWVAYCGWVIYHRTV
ncbi:MAG TPA: decaprenyl-phosphate phosphoribosyltransferase [Gemmatimonadaceae bacterium]|nr:decaprenyl-phosphate phosphoribosyltransferase [Gemmatimonadaceae bacterium]